MARWRRVDPPGIAAVITSILLVIGAALTVVFTVRIARGGAWEGNPLVGFLGVYGFMALWLGLVWRLNRTGIYVSEKALRINHPWKTRIIPWAEVAKIYSDSAVLLGGATFRPAIWIRLRDGTQIETAIQCRTRGTRGGPRKRIGPVLSRTDYDGALEVLREARTRANAS